MTEQSPETIRESVRENYAAVAQRAGAGGCCCSSSCCSGEDGIIPVDSQQLGYSTEELSAVPAGANLGLGCGNPGAIAALQPGEVVLDLGSGGGFDCFLAAQRVGPAGRVIGVDMTPDMLRTARQNADLGSYTNVEFRLGEIEALPVADNQADVIISNCVINLSPEKARVFGEAFRVLKPGGRLAISDVVANTELPAAVREDLALHAGCIAGASTIPALEAMLRAAGFSQILIRPNPASRTFIAEWAPGRGLEEFVVSATIEAVKPAAGA
jgi:arsenite methyltransferase